MSTPELHAGKAADAVLAEYAALRAELVHKLGTQGTMINLNLTAIATIAGFVIVQKADIRLLLLLPVISGVLGLLVHSEARDVILIADYIRDRQAPLLAQYLGDSRLFQYEDYFRMKKGPPRKVLLGVAMNLIFPGISLAALYFVYPYLKSAFDWTAWSLGVVLLILNFFAWVGFWIRRP